MDEFEEVARKAWGPTNGEAYRALQDMFLNGVNVGAMLIGMIDEAMNDKAKPEVVSSIALTAIATELHTDNIFKAIKMALWGPLEEEVITDA